MLAFLVLSLVYGAPAVTVDVAATVTATVGALLLVLKFISDRHQAQLAQLIDAATGRHVEALREELKAVERRADGAVAKVDVVDGKLDVVLELLGDTRRR